jgi:hypothetical protein
MHKNEESGQTEVDGVKPEGFVQNMFMAVDL